MASIRAEERMDVSCNEADDVTLVDLAINGDAGAFTQLFNRYYSMIHAFSYRMSVCEHDAQDIAQETFIKAARALHSFRRESSFKTWIYRIAVNTSRDWHRQKSRQAQMTDELEHVVNEVERKADHPLVAEALAALPDELRRAVVLVYYEEMSHGQAATVLGCSVTMVAGRVFRAKRRLKAFLSRRALLP